MKHTTQELYDCHPIWFAFLPYILALYFKRYKARKHMIKLGLEAKKVIQSPDLYAPIRDHYLAVEKAKNFNQKLIEEIIT